MVSSGISFESPFAWGDEDGSSVFFGLTFLGRGCGLFVAFWFSWVRLGLG